MKILYRAHRYGQKNGQGFYSYVADTKGRPQRMHDDTVDQLLPHQSNPCAEIGDVVIIQRMMIPMCLEVVCCLTENIIASPAEADLALVYGLGFPKFLGGACKYMDTMELAEFCRQADLYLDISPLYEAPDSLRRLVSSGAALYDGVLSHCIDTAGQ